MKKFTTIITGFIIFFGLSANIAFAAGLVIEFECNEVSTTQDGFFVTLEEPMGGESDNVKICFRVCKKKTKDGQRICTIEDSCPGGTDSTCQRVQIIKATSGANLLYTYIGMIYKWAASIIGILAVLTMVYSGVLITASNGDADAIQGAKDRISQSIAGLVVLFLSGLILYTINPTFFV